MSPYLSCEELALDYELKRYERRKDNRMAPPEYKALHPLGSSPIITDGQRALGESGAIVECLIATRGEGRLGVKHGQPGFSDYLYWFHFANGTLQPAIFRVMSLERVDPSEKNAVRRAAKERLELILSLLDERLGETLHLAGPELTAADIMTVFSLTTMRLFAPYDLSSVRASSPTCNGSARARRISARCRRPIQT